MKGCNKSLRGSGHKLINSRQRLKQYHPYWYNLPAEAPFIMKIDSKLVRYFLATAPVFRKRIKKPGVSMYLYCTRTRIQYEYMPRIQY
jgi:hypothetical protein